MANKLPQIIKRSGRTYYGCPDCGRKFIWLHKVDNHDCKHEALRVDAAPAHLSCVAE